MSSTSVNTMVPLFDGRDYRLWSQKMEDYLKSQRLWGYAVGRNTRPVEAALGAPTLVEIAAQSAWDEADEQVYGILALRLSPDLRTHLGTPGAAGAPMVPNMSAQIWASLRATFGTPGIAATFADFNQAQNIKISGNQNPQVEIERMHTLLERLRANGVILADYVQGMILLGAIPLKWDHVAAMYLQTTPNMAAVTFAGVRTAIMAEFERVARPSAHVADKISAVKRKVKSPTFQEQRKAYAPKAPQDNDHQDRPKRSKCAGKGKKREHSHIVSSALIPPAVTNHLQETHHLQTPAQAVPQVANTTVVGGPSRAPITAKPYTLASYNSRGVTYTKVPPKSPQWCSGKRGPGPATYSKAAASPRPAPPPPI